MENPEQTTVSMRGPGPEAPSRLDRVVTTALSVSLFATVGAYLGNRLGKLGDGKKVVDSLAEIKPESGHRLLTVLGGIFGGLVALGSQPGRDRVANSMKGVTPSETLAAPTPPATATAELSGERAWQGRITPDMVRERGV